MSKWLSWSCLAALGLLAAACNGATVPVGQDTGGDSGSHGSTSCSGTPLQCSAYCEGRVPAAPGECVDGTWTCSVPSCPAEPDGGPINPYDASAGCTGAPPTCGPCPQGYEPPTPACLEGVWTCGDICAGADYDGGDDGGTTPDDGGYLPDDGGYLPG